MKQNVVAITVTYNTMHTLVKTIDALLNQTYEVSKIVVVDNDSNEENKQKLKDFVQGNPKIHVLWSKRNTGGAGGFYQGMKYAKEKLNADWYWLMDDDAYPNLDCLDKLLVHKDDESNIGFLAPLIWGINYNDYQIYHHKSISKILLRSKTIIDNGVDALDDLTPIDADAFVGPLFSKAAVDTLGIADGKLFIYGDDLEYTYRVSRHFPCYLVKDAIINHQDVMVVGKGKNAKAWWKDYYMYRNLLLFANKYQENIIYKVLAIGYVIWGMGKSLVRNAIEYPKLWNVRLKLTIKALCDGLKGNKGKRIDPQKYNAFIDRLLEK